MQLPEASREPGTRVGKPWARLYKLQSYKGSATVSAWSHRRRAALVAVFPAVAARAGLAAALLDAPVMLTRLGKAWDTLRSSLWLVPSLMTLLAVALALVSIHVDRAFHDEIASRIGIVYAGGAEGARAVLSAVATSMITVAGVTFSITIVALTLASQQFGPRVLGSFLRDFGNQVVLGTFIATFVYCLLVLRTVRGSNGAEFVPQLSVSLGVALALASLGVLIYFIHHVSASIQASRIVEKIGLELVATVERLYPERIGRDDEPGSLAEDAPGDASVPIYARATGYVQAIAGDDLLALARRCDSLIRLDCRPGDFVVEGAQVARARAARGGDAREVESRLTGAIADALIVGAARTPMQDLGFAIDQLVEVAVRALSPGVNDPFTAMSCLDRLGAGLTRLAGRGIPSAHRRDETGCVRVIAPPLPFAEAMDRAFDPVRAAARGDAAVVRRLVETLGGLAAAVRRPEDRDAVLAHALLAERDARAHLDERGLMAIARHCAAIARAAGGGRGRIAGRDHDGGRPA